MVLAAAVAAAAAAADLAANESISGGSAATAEPLCLWHSLRSSWKQLGVYRREYYSRDLFRDRREGALDLFIAGLFREYARDEESTWPRGRSPRCR